MLYNIKSVVTDSSSYYAIQVLAEDLTVLYEIPLNTFLYKLTINNSNVKLSYYKYSIAFTKDNTYIDNIQATSLDEIQNKFLNILI